MSAYEMRISDWSSDVCSSDLRVAGKQPHEAVLDAVGVLELVHQQLAEALPVVRQQRRRVAQHLVRAQQDLGEVDQPGTVAALLVQREIGRASCRERGWQYVLISGDGGTIKKQNKI